MAPTLTDLPVCATCGTQYHTPTPSPPPRCRICDDPRQFVPPTGQTWTTLSTVRTNHHNDITPDVHDPRLTYIASSPKFAIGQRAILLSTPHGNVLWDMIALIDDATRAFITSKGALKWIVISHPHYYTTYAAWLAAFPGAKLLIAAEDREWLSEPAEGSLLGVENLVDTTKEVLPGVTAIKAGGHFPGSLLLHWERTLFIADTIVAVPSAYTPHPRPKGQTSYVFQWSIPNAIPLPPGDIAAMWRVVRGFEWEVTIGAFMGMEIRGHGSDEKERAREMKARMLESMKIQVRGEGWKEGQAEILSQMLE